MQDRAAVLIDGVEAHDDEHVPRRRRGGGTGRDLSIDTVPARMALSTSPTDTASSTPIAAVSEGRARRTHRKSTASTSPLDVTRENTSAVMTSSR